MVLASEIGSLEALSKDTCVCVCVREIFVVVCAVVVTFVSRFMAWRVEHKNNVIATSQDYSDQILCLASCFVCCSTMAPKMKKNQKVYADEGPIKWNVELLGSDDLFRRLGLQCNATKAEVQAALFHIIDAHAEDLSGCQVKALNIARDTLADKAKRSKWLVFYQGSRDGEKPQGAKCWAFEGGKVLALVQEAACPIDVVAVQESFGSLLRHQFLLPIRMLNKPRRHQSAVSMPATASAIN